jgi:hypothetical protein
MLLAGLCEEVIFRGTVQQRVRMLFERIPGCTILTIVVAAAIFTAGKKKRLRRTGASMSKGKVYICNET